MRTLLVVLLAFGCGSKSEKSDPPPVDKPPVVSDTKPAAGFERLEVLVGDKPVLMTRAFIKRVSTDQWRVMVGDTVGSCEELLSGVINVKPGSTHFVATIARRLSPDGAESAEVTDFYASGPNATITRNGGSVTGRADKGASAEITLGKLTEVMGGRTLTVEGSFAAIGCGDADTGGAGLPKGDHVSAATLTIAGKKFDLKGATRHGDDVLLSSSPKDCSATHPFTLVELVGRGGRWELSGTLINADRVTDRPLPTDNTKDLAITFGTTGTGADGPTVAMTLAGAGSIDGYPIALAGTIEAIDCPK